MSPTLLALALCLPAGPVMAAQGMGNDSCSGALPLIQYQTLGSNAGAVPDALGSSAAWYSYTAPVPGTLRVTTCGSHDLGGVDTGIDTLLHIYDGCPSTGGQVVAISDDSSLCNGIDQALVRDSGLDIQLAAGETTWVRVGVFNGLSGSTGDFVLSRTFIPDNDTCGMPVVIGEGTHMGIIAGAANTASSSCYPGGPDVWFEYTAGCSGLVTVSTCGTHDLGGVDQGLNTAFTVHSACPGSVSNEVACSRNALGGCGPTDLGAFEDARESFYANAGETYLIRVVDQDAQSLENEAPFLLNIHCNGEPTLFCAGPENPCPCNNASTTARGCVNSTGIGAFLTALGSTSINGNLSLSLSDAPAGQFMIFFSGLNDIELAFGDGVRCVGTDILRSPTFQTTGGVLTLGGALNGLGLSAGPSDVGSLRFIQAWFRDPQGPCGAAFNLSNAVAVAVGP